MTLFDLIKILSFAEKLKNISKVLFIDTHIHTTPIGVLFLFIKAFKYQQNKQTQKHTKILFENLEKKNLFKSHESVFKIQNLIYIKELFDNIYTKCYKNCLMKSENL